MFPYKNFTLASCEFTFCSNMYAANLRYA